MFRTKKATVGERARDKAAELADRRRDATRDVEERAAELAERLRESEALLRAKDKGAEVAARAQQKLRDAQIEARARELAERMRESDAAHHAAEAARRVTDDTLGKVGTWLATSPAADKLGVQPRKRSFPAWLAALLGMAAGYGLALLTAPKSGAEARDEFFTSAQELTRETADVIKARLGEDPRTATLDNLSVNVAEGTVFVRGTVPSGFDQGTLREIITAVPGVQDVDLQVTASA